MRLQAASIVLTLASTLLVACGSTVTGGGSSGPACFDDCDDTTTTGSTPGSGGAGGAGGGDVVPPTQQAVAMTRAQMDVLWEEYWEENPGGSSSSTTGGGGLDPNDLFLEVSSLGASCGSPFVELPCGGHWSVSIGIPTALQQVGVYELDSSALSLFSFMTETGQPYSSAPGDCAWGGGTIGSGTLEIVSINETEVQFVLALDQPWETDPSGTYTASRCP